MREAPRFGTALILALLPLSACNRPAEILYASPDEARSALDRINTNLAAITGTLSCQPARVSFKYRDPQGRVQRFIGHPAAMLFEPPRCMLLEIRSALGPTVAHVGTNDDRYWFWVDAQDVRKLWWGTWAGLEQNIARRGIIPADKLLEALMLGPLVQYERSGLHPLLQYVDEQPWLIFQALDRRGWPYVRRAMLLDRKPPYLPIRIIDHDEQGRVAMLAQLRNYKRVGGAASDGPYIAHGYVVDWPLDDVEFRMDFDRVRFREMEFPFCEFPPQWNGEIECFDEAALSPGGSNFRQEAIGQS